MNQPATQGLDRALDQEANGEEAARLARRVRLMMMLAALTTALAMAAVFVTIGYRLLHAEGSGSAAVDVTATLPKGARIVSTSTAGDRVIVTVETPAGTEIRTFDAHSLKPVGRLRFATEP